MSKITRPLQSTNRQLPFVSTTRERVLPIQNEFPVAKFTFVLFSQQVFLGAQFYPFGPLNLDLPADRITQVRWRVNAGSWTVVTVGTHTDLLAATRFIKRTASTFGTETYDLEITDDESNIETRTIAIVTKISILSPQRSAKINKTVLVFSTAAIANDPTLINKIEYSVSGDTTVANTTITRKVIVSGTHTGANNASILTDSVVVFADLNEGAIRIDLDIVKNTTDLSEGKITAISGNTITATLAGGTDNDWDTSDAYQVVDGDSLDIIAKKFELSFASAGRYVVTLRVTDSSLNVSTASITMLVN